AFPTVGPLARFVFWRRPSGVTRKRCDTWANSELMQRSKGRSLFDHFVGARKHGGTKPKSSPDEVLGTHSGKHSLWPISEIRRSLSRERAVPDRPEPRRSHRRARRRRSFPCERSPAPE